MIDFIPYEKMTKKQKKEFNSIKRRTWAISPVTRTADGKRGYNRTKEKSKTRGTLSD